MSDQKISQTVSKIAKRLDEVRDLLFESSRQCVNSGGGEWQMAEALFTLARSADLLKQQVSQVTDSAALATRQITQGHLPAEDAPAAAKLPRKRKADYPKFVVRSDCLLKIGLSRDKRTEYEHEVPKPEFEKIIARLAALPTDREITVEEMQEGLDCPSYQTYVVIAVLLQMGLLMSPWRGAYKIANARKFTTDANSVWNRLPRI